MKLRLPISLRNILLSTFSVAVTVLTTTLSPAATIDDLWLQPTFGGPVFTWTGAAGTTSLNTAGNWAEDKVPARDSDKGPHFIFNNVTVTTTDMPDRLDTSDDGGVTVTGTSDVTVSLGRWGGSILVGAGSTLSTSFTEQLKNTEGENHANVYVDGILNLSTPAGNLNFDQGDRAGNQFWHIGATGTIHLDNTTTVTKNGKTWNVEVVVPEQSAAEEIPGLTNRTISDNAVVSRQFMTTGANIGNQLDSLVVWELAGDTYTQLTQVDSLDALTQGNYVFVSTPTGMSIKYLGAGYAAATLVWMATGDNAVWSNLGTGWYVQGADKTDTSFLNGDSVVFTADEGAKTITVDGAVEANTITLGNGAEYTFLLGEGASLVSIRTILGDNATLAMGDAENRINTFTGRVDGADSATLTLYLSTNSNADGNGTIILDPESTVKNVYVNGAFAVNLNGGGPVSSLAGADLHMMDGGTFVLRNTLNNAVLQPAKNVIVEGYLNLQVYGSVSTAALTSNFIGADGADTSLLKTDGGTVTMKENTVTLSHLYVQSGTLILGQGNTTTAGQVRLSENGAGTLTVNSGSRLDVTGNNNTHETSASFILAHWGQSSTLNLNGGVINANNASMHMSWTGTGTFRATAGTANLKGIDFWAQEDKAFRGQLYLGSETTGSARINIGSNSITNCMGDSVVKLGEGTLGATADWAFTYNHGVTDRPLTYIELIGQSKGTLVDTLDAANGTDARTITFENGLTGSGKLVKTGEGTLVLNGAAKTPVTNDEGTVTDAGFTGTVELREGNLTVANSSVIGRGALLINGGRTVTVSDTAGYDLIAGSTLGVTDFTGATATLSGNLILNGGSLLFGGLDATTAALTITGNVSGNAATQITINSLSLAEGTRYALLTGTGLATSDFFTLGGTIADIYSGAFSVAENTLYLTLTQRADLKTWHSGTWSTTASDESWNVSGNPTSFSNNDAVYFSNGDGVEKNVVISGTVTPGKIGVIGTDFVIGVADGDTASGIAGTGALTLFDGSSLTINNANTGYAGTATLYAGSTLTLGNVQALGTGSLRVEGNASLLLGAFTTSNETTLGTNAVLANNAVLSIGVADGTRHYDGTMTGQGTIRKTGAGTLQLRYLDQIASGVTLELSEGGVYIQDGSNPKAPNKTLSKLVASANANVTLGFGHGTGDMTIGEVSLEAGSKLTYSNFWNFGFSIAKLTGSGTLDMIKPANGYGSNVSLIGDSPDFSGTISVRNGSALTISSAHALGSGSVNLNADAANTLLLNASDVTLGGLTGSLGVVKATGMNATLTLDIDAANTTANSFGGTIIDGSDSGTARILSLVKTGDGTMTLSGANTYSGKTTVANGTLAFTNAAATTMHSIAMGAGARMNSSSTAITLATGSTLEFDMTGAAANTPVISWTSAALTLSDASHKVTLSGLETIDGGGTYTLASWNSLATPDNAFTLTNPTTSADGNFTYELAYNDAKTALILTITDNRITSGFVWNGGSEGASKWVNDNVVGWEARGTAAGTTLAGQDVIFTANQAGEVVVSGQVTPKSVLFSGGVYTISSDPDKESGIADMDDDHQTTLTVSGSSTNVTLNLANTYTGGTNVNGGTLTAGVLGALGEGNVNVSGGELILADSTVLTPANALNLTGGTLTLNGAEGTNAYGMLNLASWTGGTLSLSANVSASLTTAMAKAGQAVALAAGSTLTLGEGALGADTYSVNATGTGALKLQFTSNVYGGHILDTGAFNGTVWVTGGNFMIHQITTGNNAVVKLGEGTNATNMEVQSNATPILTRNYVIEGSAVAFHLTGSADRTFTGSFTGRAFTKEGAKGMTLQGAVNLTEGTLTVNNGTLTIASAQVGNLGSGWNIAQGKTLAFTNATNTDADGVTYGNAISGAGTIQLNSGKLALTNGAVGGSVNLAVAEGELTLTGAHTSTGNLAITNEKSTVRLGTIKATAQWAGSALSGAGTLKIVNGSLAQAMTRADGSTASIAVDAGANTAIDLGGTSGSLLSSVTLGAGSTLTNVNGNLVVGETGGLTSLTLTLTNDNISQTSGTATAKIDQGNANLDLKDGASVTLNIDAIVGVLLKDSDNFLALTTGNITGDYANIQFDKTLSTLGYRITGVDGGQLVLSGKAEGAYKVTGPTDETSEKPVVVNDYNTLGMYNSVVIDRNLSLVVNLPANPAIGEALHINNLLGATGSSLIVNNKDAAANALVLLNTDTDIAGGVGNLIGNDEEHAGNAGVTFIKQGQGTLTVSGRVETFTLQLQEGTLVIAGQGSKIGFIQLNGLVGAPLPELAITGSATAGCLTDDVIGSKGGKVTLGQNAMLTLNEASDLSQSSIEGSGTLRLENTLTLSGTAKIDGDLLVDLVGPDHADAQTFAAGDPVGTLDLGTTTDNRIGGLSGGGVLKGNGGAIAVGGNHGSVFEGSFEGSGTFTVETNATQTLLNATTATGSQWNIVNNGKLTITTGGSIGHPAANAGLSLHSITLGGSSTTYITLNTDNATSFTVDGTMKIEDGASITLSSTGEHELVVNDDGSCYTLVKGGTFDLSAWENGEVAVSLDAASTVFNQFATEAWLRVDDNGNLVLYVEKSESNKYAAYAMTANSLAGAELLWRLGGAGIDANSVLGQVRQGILGLIKTGDQAEISRAMAAVAGSTVASLGMAQKDALRDQMGWIRNRLTNMGVDQALVNEDMPYFHMWAQATGNHATLDNKGDESGYTLDTWGGTVGLDLDVNEYLTFGAAFTAAYGDLDATGAETATGDLDSYYVNLFGRAQVKRWTHKLILSVGINDAKLTRTVDYGAGSYKARGTTNGTGFGAMYELTYDTYLNRERTAVLQPLLNLSIVSTTMDAYSENDGGTAGNAGLNVGKQDMTVGTVALGVRLAGQLSENALGRASFGEFRVNVAQDMGDDRSSASVGFIGAPGMTQRIRGAKEGMMAIQIGAGLTVPVGEQSGIFFDVNADFRSHASSVNGSVGYRYDF